jgi:hypothetical protein
MITDVSSLSSGLDPKGAVSFGRVIPYILSFLLMKYISMHIFGKKKTMSII